MQQSSPGQMLHLLELILDLPVCTTVSSRDDQWNQWDEDSVSLWLSIPRGLPARDIFTKLCSMDTNDVVGRLSP